MHCIAGALLLVQFALMWILEKTVTLRVLDYMAMITWLVAMGLISLPMLALRKQGRVPPGESFVSTEALVDSGVCPRPPSPIPGLDADVPRRFAVQSKLDPCGHRPRGRSLCLLVHEGGRAAPHRQVP
jgi:hypothetical protein